MGGFSATPNSPRIGRARDRFETRPCCTSPLVAECHRPEAGRSVRHRGRAGPTTGSSEVAAGRASAGNASSFCGAVRSVAACVMPCPVTASSGECDLASGVGRPHACRSGFLHQLLGPLGDPLRVWLPRCCLRSVEARKQDRRRGRPTSVPASDVPRPTAVPNRPTRFEQPDAEQVTRPRRRPPGSELSLAPSGIGASAYRDFAASGRRYEQSADERPSAYERWPIVASGMQVRQRCQV